MSQPDCWLRAAALLDASSMRCPPPTTEVRERRTGQLPQNRLDGGSRPRGSAEGPGGGGEALTTSDPGAPYPELRVTHTYTERGTPEVVLTTAYTGEYSVAGGPWLPVTGQASVTSDPIPLRVLAGTNSLVADPPDSCHFLRSGGSSTDRCWSGR